MTPRRRKKIVLYAAMTALAGIAVFAHVVSTRAIFVSSPTKPILPGDITTTEILDRTVLDADVSNTAEIAAVKIAPRGTPGMVLLSNGTTISTSTSLVMATSTPVLSVIGGRISATSTSFNGVDMSWPSADGTNGQLLTTNGSGAYSYSSVSTAFNLTAGQTLAVNDPVVVEDTTNSAANISNTDQASTVTICDLNKDEWFQIIQESTSKLWRAIDLSVSKVGSPAGRLAIHIVPVVAGLPSRTQTIASTTIAAADISGTPTTRRATFFPAAYIPANAKIAVRILGETCTLDDASNYFVADRGTTGNYANGNDALFNDGTFTFSVNRQIFFTLVDVGTTAGRVYLSTGAATTTASTTIGFISAAVSTSSTASILGTGNVITGLRTMVINKAVYLGADPRTLVQTSAMFSKVLGIAISATSMLVHIVPF